MSNAAMLAEAPSISSLCDSIVARREQNTDRRRYRQDRPRASSIGDCAREGYHQIVDWELRPEPHTELAQRFQRGHEVERLVVRQLLDDGWNVCETNVPFEIKEFIPELGREIIILTGHCDGRIKISNDFKPVFDVKSLHPNVWARVQCVQDFAKMGSFWTHYIRQLLIYCYQYNEPFGLFLLDDMLGHWKALPVVLMDLLGECEQALRTARTAAIAVEKGEPPPLHHDPTVCAKCWVRQVGKCFPAIAGGEGVQLVDDVEIALALARMNELESASDEYASLEKRVKERFKASGVGSYLAGDFVVNVEVKPRASYEVPASVKQQYKTEGSATYVKWEKLGIGTAGTT